MQNVRNKAFFDRLSVAAENEDKAQKEEFFDTCVPQRKLSAVTIRAYLQSIRHFYSYLIERKGSTLSTDDMQSIRSMNGTVARWIMSARKECSKRGLEKMEEAFQNLITPEDIVAFEKSKDATSGVKLMGVAPSQNSLITRPEFTTVRNFILTQIALSNASRSGVFANMTIKEFKTARVLDERYVISVCDHKTAHLQGPAKIVLTTTIYGWLKTYIHFVRKFASRSHQIPEVFITWLGEAMTSGGITQCVQAIWKKTGLQTEITFNIVRKTAVSAMHQKHPNMKESLANLMCHSVNTATRCYRVIEREHSSVAASKQLAETIRTPAVHENSSHTTAASGSHTKDEDGGTQETEASALTQNSCDDDTDVVPPSVTSRWSKDIFSEDEVMVIQRCCGRMITAGPISQTAVQAAMNGDMAGQEMLQKYTVEQIINRLKYERRRGRAKVLETLFAKRRKIA